MWLPDGIKPLPEPMLIYHKQGPVALILSKLQWDLLGDKELKLVAD